MICTNCGSDMLIPVLFGQPNAEAWNAMQRGKVSLGGSLVSDDDNRWFCDNCCEETVADDDESYWAAVQSACESSQDAVDSDTATAVRGFQMAQRLVYLFAMLGAKSVRIFEAKPQNSIFAMIDDEWGEYDWGNTKYLPEMLVAFRHQLMPSQTTVNRQQLVVSVRELNDAEHGLQFEINAP
jgi:hypothetical protein